MTRREFVAKAFEKNLNEAIASIKNGKGVYSQYVDSWDHSINIDFQIVHDVVVAEIRSESEMEYPTRAKKTYDKTWALLYWNDGRVDHMRSIEDALLDILLDAHEKTGYKPALPEA